MKHYKIVFIGRSLDHINLPFCLELYNHYKNDFLFIATANNAGSRSGIGYSGYNDKYDFVFKAYESKETIKMAREICYDTDILIYGAVVYRQIIRKRLHSSKITFKLSERFIKTKMNFIKRIKARIGVFIHYYLFNKKNKYILCMGGYVSKDLDKYHLFKNKRFKWGYFTDVTTLPLDELNSLKNHKIELLWVGRFIGVKQPSMIIKLAQYLKDNNIDAHITMAGYGDLLEGIKEEILQQKLDKYISLVGAVDLKKKEELMNNANIFLFTSTFEEGWGAVVNEAMGSACLTIGTKESGSSSAIIENGKNGYLFAYNNQDEFNELVKKCIIDYDNLYEIRKNGYESIHNEWNSVSATRRLIKILDSLLLNGSYSYESSGPCSKA